MEPEKPLRYRWLLIIVLLAWGLMLVCFQAGIAYSKLIHTIIVPPILLIAIATLSVSSIATAWWYQLFMAGWAGIMIPTVYLFMSWLTGFGHHCDRASVMAGAIVCSALSMEWAITTMLKSKCRTNYLSPAG